MNAWWLRFIVIVVVTTGGTFSLASSVSHNENDDSIRQSGIPSGSIQRMEKEELQLDDETEVTTDGRRHEGSSDARASQSTTTMVGAATLPVHDDSIQSSGIMEQRRHHRLDGPFVERDLSVATSSSSLITKRFPGPFGRSANLAPDQTCSSTIERMELL